MAELPYSEPELIPQLKRDYEGAAQHGGQEAMDSCFRLAWALVHSRERKDVVYGIELLEALQRADSHEERDIKYLLAVGHYRVKKYIEARRLLKGVMEMHPDFRQAESLLAVCEREIVKDGLVGVGAGAAVVAGLTALAVALAKR